jgi:hypothetical protein
MKKKIAAIIEQSEKLYPSIKRVNVSHATWYKFSKWLGNTFGKDLYQWKEMDLPRAKGGTKKFKYRDFNEAKLYNRLVGYEVQCKIEKYIKRCCPEIKCIRCDDSIYATAIILLIPHPAHGITVMFIPQCTSVQNVFFLYQRHCENLIKELTKMKKVYKGIF